MSCGGGDIARHVKWGHKVCDVVILSANDGVMSGLGAAP